VGPVAEPQVAPQKLFTVTTRSRLRGPWFFPQMMIATLRVRRQLARTGNVVGWANIVAGPSEFWTITAWRNRQDKQEFMRSGAHDEIMWLFSKWLDSFWLMRWHPGPVEIGRWKGMSMAQPDPEYRPAWAGNGDATKLGQALEYLPKLKSAVAVDGAATFDTTVYARRRRAEVSDAGGAVVHIATSPWRTAAATLALRRLRQEAEIHPDLLRAVVGVSRPGHVYMLTVWRDRAGARQLLASPQLRALARQWPGCWANEWLPENEFGHWDGLRLRRARRRYSIRMPKAALELGDPTSG